MRTQVEERVNDAPTPLGKEIGVFGGREEGFHGETVKRSGAACEIDACNVGGSPSGNFKRLTVDVH